MTASLAATAAAAAADDAAGGASGDDDAADDDDDAAAAAAAAAAALLAKARRVVVVLGAGVSQAAGVPLFRGRGGLYERLAELFPSLSAPRDAFSLAHFARDSRPLYATSRLLWPCDQRAPTAAHHFVAMLAQQQTCSAAAGDDNDDTGGAGDGSTTTTGGGGRLLTCFTQNLDELEAAAGVPEDRLVRCHGSFLDAARCIACGAAASAYAVQAAVFGGGSDDGDGDGGDDDNDGDSDGKDQQPVVSIARCDSCGVGALKPGVVLFGEPLPAAYHRARLQALPHADAVLVLGASLAVFPVCELVEAAPASAPRIIVNIDSRMATGAGAAGDGAGACAGAGDAASAAAGNKAAGAEAAAATTPPLVLVGTCDAVARALADRLGWRGELEARVQAATKLKKLFCTTKSQVNTTTGLPSGMLPPLPPPPPPQLLLQGGNNQKIACEVKPSTRWSAADVARLGRPLPPPNGGSGGGSGGGIISGSGGGGRRNNEFVWQLLVTMCREQLALVGGSGVKGGVDDDDVDDDDNDDDGDDAARASAAATAADVLLATGEEAASGDVVVAALLRRRRRRHLEYYVELMVCRAPGCGHGAELLRAIEAWAAGEATRAAAAAADASTGGSSSGSGGSSDGATSSSDDGDGSSSCCSSATAMALDGPVPTQSGVLLTLLPVESSLKWWQRQGFVPYPALSLSPLSSSSLELAKLVL